MDWAQFIAENIPTPVTASVQAYSGQGAHGKVYAAAADVAPCIAQGKRRRVSVQTQDIAGGIVISSTTVWCPPGTTAPVESLVTVPGDATARRVLQRNDWDDHGLGLPSHVELLLE